MTSTPNLCLACRGSRNLCRNKTCPLLARFSIKSKINKISTDFFGPSTSIFVGHQNYPNVYIGPLAAIEADNLNLIDQPSKWFGLDYSKIIELRSLLLRSKYRQNIKSSTKFVQENQLLTLAQKPTDVELNFKKKPVYEIKFSDILQPMGPSALLEKLRITENIKIDRKVEYIVSDQLKANESAFKLYETGIDIYKITNILSSGILGIKKKMVPTRWSITAIDDLIGKQLINQIKNYPSINEYLVFSSEYLSNHFEILLMPGNWEFENFEAWAPGSTWAQGAKQIQILQEYESDRGRTKYADKQVGGYYAARLAAVEFLNKIKRQARIIGFREISEGYTIPLGVWQVRENVRNALKNPPARFNNLNSALNYINSKTRINIDEYKKKSKILGQKRLIDF